MKVVFVCEDPVNDQYLAGPVIKACLAALGKPRVQVAPVLNPRTRGFENLVDNACGILERYGPVARVVIFVIDTDCEDGREGRRNKALRMRNAVEKCEFAERALVVAAVQELEVWALWGARASLGVSWDEVLAECDPKERFFDTLLTNADRTTPDGGRKRLVATSLSNGYGSLAAGCEELVRLQNDLRPYVTS